MKKEDRMSDADVSLLRNIINDPRPAHMIEKTIAGGFADSLQKLDVSKNSALRFDKGKPELFHIHPIPWQMWIRDKVDYEIEEINDAVDEFFYFGNEEILYDVWKNVPSEYVDLMIKVLEHGATKYAALNYAQGMNFTRVLGSFRRHIYKLAQGQTHDDDSGVEHEGHIVCNMMFFVVYLKCGVGTDNRIILTRDKNVTK